jgi:hypothetical protein
MVEFKNVRLGTVQVDKIFVGEDLLWSFKTDTISPVTTTYPLPANYIKGGKIWFEVDEMCTTYYTMDGSTPTIASPIFREAFTLNTTTTLKYFSVDVLGNTEAVKTTTYTITEPITSWRYLKIQGYGTSLDTTTRMIEFEAWHGATNRMTLATILSNDAISTGSTDVNTIKDGVKTTTTNTYPIWWSAVPNANVVIDLGDWYALTKLNYYSFSNAGDQRQNRFKVFASTTNNGTDWTLLWDMSTNTTPQPILPNGYEKTL